MNKFRNKMIFPSFHLSPYFPDRSLCFMSISIHVTSFSLNMNRNCQSVFCPFLRFLWAKNQLGLATLGRAVYLV